MSKIIMRSDKEAATYRTGMKGWVSRNYIYFGDNKNSESLARYNGCTHVPCKYCGEPAPKAYTACKKCRERKKTEHYNKLPSSKWDGKSPIYSEYAARMFQDIDNATAYAEAYDITLADLQLLLCESIKYRHIDEDYWADCLPDEDSELPNEIKRAIDELNRVLDETYYVAYEPSRIKLDLQSLEDAER